MGGYGDALALQQQEKINQQQAATSSPYNPDGSGKANDYHPPPLPQSSFPPASAPGQGITVDRAQLTAVANQMKADLNLLQAALNQLNGAGAGGELIGGWSTADAFGNNAGNAYWGITQFYSDLNAAYDQVIGYLHQTMNNYADAETTTAAAANRVGAETNGPLSG
jgi:hypothetical protein